MKRKVTTTTKKIVIAAARHRCAKCARRFTVDGHVDHTAPRWAGGGDDVENLQALCTGCHGRKTADEAIMRASARVGRCIVCGGDPAGGAACPGPAWPAVYYTRGVCVPMQPPAAACPPAVAGFSVRGDSIVCARCGKAWSNDECVANEANLVAHRESAACARAGAPGGVAKMQAAMARFLSGRLPRQRRIKRAK